MRVYIDKQIISHLYKKEKKEYVQLLEKILNSKNHLLFCFSTAHLLDLKNDKTNIKYLELEFFKNIVDNNYITYNNSSKTSLCYLATPLEVFSEIEEDEKETTDFNSIFDFDSAFLNEAEKVEFDKIRTLLDDFKFDFSAFFDNIPSEYKSLIDRLAPDHKNQMTISEMIEQGLNFQNKIQADNSIYRDFRNIIDRELNGSKSTIDYNSLEFKNFQDSKSTISFIDFVKSTLIEKDINKISNYDFFSQAYFLLDLLGISKESGVKFKNMTNDSLHSYYAAHCDIVVSDDLGFINKTKIIYKLLGIDTQVLTADEFIKSFSFKIETIENDIQSFNSLLVNDVKHGLVIRNKPSLKFDRVTSTIKTSHNYLGHLNRIDLMVEDKVLYVYLYHEMKNYSNFTFYKEYQLIVNRAIDLFGNDLYFRSKFDWDLEIIEINEGKWKGRFWDFETFSITLEYNSGNEKIGLLYTFK